MSENRAKCIIWRPLRAPGRVLGAHGRVHGAPGCVLGAHGRVLGAHSRALSIGGAPRRWSTAEAPTLQECWSAPALQLSALSTLF